MEVSEKPAPKKKAAPAPKKDESGTSDILSKPKITYPDYEFHESFFVPAVFGVVEDIYNTHHGEFPLMPPHNFDQKEPDTQYGVWSHFNQRQP